MAIPSRFSLSNTPIAVLGGGGFLGSHLIEALLRAGCPQLCALDLAFAKIPASCRADRRLRLIEGSVAEPEFVHQLLGDYPVLVSMTALCRPALYNTAPLEVIDASYDHLRLLVDEATRLGRRLIHLSTCEVYGLGERGAEGIAPMVEDDSPLVLGPLHEERWTYACAKQLLERRLWAQMRHQGLQATIIRPFNVIGPRMDFLPGIDGEGVPRVLANFIGALIAGRPLCLVDGGHQQRSFIHVDDFTAALLRTIENPRTVGEVLNIGHPDNQLSIAELAQRLVAAYRQRRPEAPIPAVRSVSARELYGEGYADVVARIPDMRKTQALLHWQPQIGLDALLQPILDDYLAHYDRPAGDDAIAWAQARAHQTTAQRGS